MAVDSCTRCSRSISISRAPGGNPTALADPDTWSVDYGMCRTCRPKGLLRVRPHYCDRCIAESTKCPVCGTELEVFRISRVAGLALEGLASQVGQPLTALAVLAKARLSSVLEVVERSAPCPVGWLVPGAYDAVKAVVVAVDCGDMDLASTFTPLKELARSGVPVIAGLLSNTAVDAELSDLVELETREHLTHVGYPGDGIPILRLDGAGAVEDLKRIIRECGIHFEV